MTLDEAICHAEEVAEENYGKATAYLSDREVYKHEEQKCLKCADEHMQLAEWLRDYKRLLAQPSRMKYVQEAVNTIMDACNTDKITDKAMRNAARFVQNAIDGSEPEFEALEQEPKTEKVIKMRDATPEERELIDKYIKSISKPTGVIFGALEQEPSGDCISRQAVTDTTICEGISCNECSFNTCEDGQLGCLLKERVDKLPPVKPQERTGHWIKMPLIDAGQTYSHKCSLCGRKILALNVGLSEFPYCHCGARMEVEKYVPDINDGKISENPTGSESEDKCKNCEYYRNPDYTRCHKCKAESEVRCEY